MKDEQDKELAQPATEPVASKGVLVTEGAEFTIHGLTLSIGADGPKAAHERISLRQDLCRHWLRIASRHVLEAAHAQGRLTEAEGSGAEDRLGPLIEEEFKSSMQAIVASAIALDAFYSAVIERVGFANELREAWAKNRTSRSSRMAELFRRAFAVPEGAFKGMRGDLKQVIKYRDWAVHPPADQQNPVLREDIRRSVEWRFVAFRHANAAASYRIALGTIRGLTNRSDLKPEALLKYCEALCPALETLPE